MDDVKAEKKNTKTVRTLEEEISAQREKLKKLEDRQREQQRKEREHNQKSVMNLIKAEKLDSVSVEKWKLAMPSIKMALFSNHQTT